MNETIKKLHSFKNYIRISRKLTIIVSKESIGPSDRLFSITAKRWC